MTTSGVALLAELEGMAQRHKILVSMPAPKPVKAEQPVNWDNVKFGLSLIPSGATVAQIQGILAIWGVKIVNI